jgi:PKD domain
MLRAMLRHRHDASAPRALQGRLGRILCGALVGLAALACLGPATALAGTGVSFVVGSKTINVSGGQISASADVHGTSYTLKAPGGHSQQIELTGLSIGALLQLAGFDPQTIQSLQVSHPDGTQTDLTQAEIAGTAFPEGPAIVLEKGSTTVFFRPITGPGDNNAPDEVASSSGEPIDFTVQISAQLKITASATPKRASVGQSVTFSAAAADLPPGADVTYDWSFGDGTTASGAQVTHAYSVIGQYAAAVTASVSASLGSAGASQVLTVVVGHPKKAKVAGAGTSDSGAGGSGTGKGGSGTGRGSQTKPASAAAPKTAAKSSSAPGVAKPLASQAPDSQAGEQVEGILLTGSGTPLAPLVAAATPSGSTASSAAQTASTGSAGVGAAGAGIALMIAIVTLGALDERRRISLRTA